MCDLAARVDGEDAEGRQRTHHPPQLPGTHAGGCREIVDVGCLLRGDPVGQAEIGDQPDGARHLEAPDQQIERSAVVHGNPLASTAAATMPPGERSVRARPVTILTEIWLVLG